MRRSRSIEEQIVGILKEHEAGAQTAALCRQHSISEQTFYLWKTKYNALCGKCGGSGQINSLRGIQQCPVCKGVGTFRDVKCEKCKQTGKIDCKAKGCEHEVKPPTFESFADAFQCQTCKGKGILARWIAFPCPDCLGLGLHLAPKEDTSKLLR